MIKIHSRSQRTLARPTQVVGKGYLTGETIQLRLKPAPANTGVVFVRTDLPGRPQIPAQVEQVSGTDRRTTLGKSPASVCMVEHILAALAGLRIDNCLIEIDGPELPGLDGSALGFVYHLGEAGVQHQPESRALWTVEKPISLEKDGATLTLHPLAHPQIKISYFLDFGPYSQPPQQRITVTLTPETFAYELANSRTFLREKEAKELRSQGIGKKVGIADLVIFGDKGPIQNPLRFADEPARHKILDLVGDLSLSGTEICGHVVAYKSGHPLNIALAREIKKRLAHAPHIFAA